MVCDTERCNEGSFRINAASKDDFPAPEGAVTVKSELPAKDGAICVIGSGFSENGSGLSGNALPELPPRVFLGVAAIRDFAVRVILFENAVRIVAQIVESQFLVRFGEDV